MMNGLNSNGEVKHSEPMKTPQLIATLMKGGGRILIVGGGTEELPDSITRNPQIIIWDDNKQGIEQKEVPSNVKVIMYNRWISHTNRWRLDNAAKSLRAIKEIKELLSEFIQAEPIEMTKEKVDEVVLDIVAREEFIEEKLNETPVEPSETVETNEGLDMSKANGKRGTLKDFIIKHINLNTDYSKKGTIAVEARRLFDKAKSSGLKTTIGSMNQGISVLLKEIKKNKGEVPKAKPEHGTGVSLAAHVPVKEKRNNNIDDFEQLDVFIQDAIAAMKLIQEHLPKVRKETERLRSMKDKVLKLFGE